MPRLFLAQQLDEKQLMLGLALGQASSDKPLCLTRRLMLHALRGTERQHTARRATIREQDSNTTRRTQETPGKRKAPRCLPDLTFHWLPVSFSCGQRGGNTICSTFTLAITSFYRCKSYSSRLIVESERLSSMFSSILNRSVDNLPYWNVGL